MKSLDANNLMTESHERVANLIPYGKENAISRDELSLLTGFCDRKVRDIIADLRENEIFVCSTSSQRGYWMATKREELEDLANEYHDRGIDCLSKESKIRKYIRVHEDQLKGI